MDRSFHSPFTPRPLQSVSSKRSFVPSSFRKSTRLSLSGKSAQSIHIILKSQNNYVERFGHSLPVLVTEALTFAERNTVISARISECGYAWLVCGRRLLVWQYRQNMVQLGTPQKKQMVGSLCFELQLPQSDLAHRAELVSVFISNLSNTPSCIAVSPEGVVRYWPAVIHESISIEQIVDLQGQECDSLTDIGDLGCILATTTCSVVWVQPHLAAGRHSLSCRTLRPPTGWLGGISKKLSSFVFGPLTGEQSAETRLVRVLTVCERENLWIVYVLAGHSLQKWRISNNDLEQFIFVTELNRYIRDGFHTTIWENCGGDQTETDTWLLDIQSDKDNIIILAAAINMHVSPQVHYALVSVQTNTPQPPSNIRDFLVLKINSFYREDNPAESLSYRFLLCGTSAYLYNQRSITIIKPQEDPDTLEFSSPQDFLLGGSICVNTPVFFSRNHGLVSVSSNDMISDLNISMISVNNQLDTTLNESLVGNLSMYNMDAEEIYNSYKDTVSQLKAAFIFHVKNQQAACQDILQELFLTEEPFIPRVDSTLDKMVIMISQELLDDIPAGDPRWNQKNKISIGSSYSMHILQQLQDKQKALNLFIRFLHDTELWNKLTAVTIRDMTMATVFLLSELSEKIVAAVSLKKVSNNGILQKAIDSVVNNLEVVNENNLTNQDIFFSKVTKIHLVFQELVNKCDETAHSDLSPSELSVFINDTNEILLNIIKEIIQYRKQNIENYIPQPTAIIIAPDYLPWTSIVGPHGLHDSFVLQQSLTCNYGARISGDSFLSNTLYDQLVDLIDLILNGNKSHLESIKGTKREDVVLKQYEADKHKFILPLVVDKQWEKAALLAEKYLDFETLINICESTNNSQRLDDYMERFSLDGFSEFVFSWYLQMNRPGKLINLCRTTKNLENSHKLTNFLANHPSLFWIQNILDKKFSNAANILRDLGLQETESLVRQKTILSLSKLAKLAAPEADDCNDFTSEINSQLELVSFQEDIPDYVLQHYGYDVIKPRVIAPKDLIYLYTCVEYKEATELEFKKALDMLQYIDSEELKCELTLDVWKGAILRDSWIEGKMDSALEIVQNTLFFKLADLSLYLGVDPQTLLPPLDMLMEIPELETLQQSKNFQYLIKIVYEHVYKT